MPFFHVKDRFQIQIMCLKITFLENYIYLSVRKDNLSWIDSTNLPQDFQKKWLDPIPTFDIKFGAGTVLLLLLAIIPQIGCSIIGIFHIIFRIFRRIRKIWWCRGRLWGCRRGIG